MLFFINFTQHSFYIRIRTIKSYNNFCEKKTICCKNKLNLFITRVAENPKTGI